jgi:hypothetical protein
LCHKRVFPLNQNSALIALTGNHCRCSLSRDYAFEKNTIKPGLFLNPTRNCGTACLLETASINHNWVADKGSEGSMAGLELSPSELEPFQGRNATLFGGSSGPESARIRLSEGYVRLSRSQPALRFRTFSLVISRAVVTLRKSMCLNDTEAARKVLWID